MKNYVGIDISQQDFHVYHPEAAQPFGTYLNTECGVRDFLSSLGAQDHCVLEATGTYSLLLTYRLVDARQAVSVINPKDSKHFRTLLNITWKDDQSDARLLSVYGERMQPKAFRPTSKTLFEIKQRRGLLRQLQKQKTALQNIRHSLQAHPFKDEETETQIDKTVEHLCQQIKSLKLSIGQITEDSFEEEFKLVNSVKGIGQVMATALIEATHGFTAFENPRQFAKFIDICPTYGESGTSVRFKSKINRSGDPNLRATLYVCTWSAIRYNKACKDVYERLIARGKPGKVALVAVMNKLIRQVFAVVQKGEKFDNDFEENARKVAA